MYIEANEETFRAKFKDDNRNVDFELLAVVKLLKSVSLKSEESALTGESVPSEKDAEAEVAENAGIGDRSNMVFSGCSVTYGTATAVVTGTGMETEMGKIAGLLEGEEEGQTPLQQKLAQLGKYLGFVALAACAIIFVVGLMNGIDVLEIFMTAVSLAVSAIPEGLPAIVTIVLAIGVQRMVKKNALIRRLPAVETLGSASVICSDKTGTLTQNRMTLVKAYVDGESSLEDISSANSDSVRKLLQYGALCCDGSVIFGAGGKEQHIGDPTETSIIVAAHKNGMEKDALNGQFPRLAEIPFDSDRKLMTTVNQIGGKNIVIVKGAFDMMTSRCVKGDMEAARQMNDEMSRNALRVLAVGYKEIAEIPAVPTSEELENGLTFMGLVGMIDPPRPEAKAAVAVCRKAGIKPVMITGDHVVTASAIAKELGILEDGDKAITGAELDAMTEEQLDNEVEHISVYARVSPENKIRIVKAWQRKNQVVSMTGDGVNDAPALKAADIGCAMGITGTDVAKGAADMILTDDNFATIVHAVEQGRGIYANIKKSIHYLLSCNIGEILTLFLATLFHFHQAPLVPVQLLWLNLVTDSLPALALGLEPVEADVMEKPPRKAHEPLFTPAFTIRLLWQGALVGALTLLAYFVGEYVLGDPTTADATANTMAFATLTFCQLFHAFDVRSEHQSLLSLGVFTNPAMNQAFVVGAALQLAVLLLPPLMGVFHVTFLTFQQWLVVVILSITPVVVTEVEKRFFHSSPNVSSHFA